MIKTILIVVGSLLLAFCVLTVYCCLVVASREDEALERLYMDAMYQEQQQNAQAAALEGEHEADS